jgi:HlyD family secretion protein
MRPYILAILMAMTVGAIVVAAYTLGAPPVASTAQQTPTAAQQTPTAAPTTAATTQTPAQARQPLVVEARVAPVRSVELTLPVSGVPIAEVLVREGDTVALGTPLVRLDTRDLQLEVDQARAALAQTGAEYDKLLAGAPPAEVAEAKARLSEAQAQLAQVKGHVTPQDLAAAQAQLDQARTRLADLEAGARPAELDQARSRLAEAKSDLDQQRSELSAAKEQARRLMEERANDLRTAQLAYTSARQNREQTGGDSTDARTRALDEAVAKAKLAMDNAQSALDRAKVEYEDKHNSEIAGIAAGEAKVAAAQAQLDQLLAGAKPGDLADARAAVAAAEAELGRLQGAERAGELNEASAAVSQARAHLEGLTAKPRQASIEQVKAAIQQSEVNVKRAELALERATLSAPMAGVIAAVNVAQGESTDEHEIAVVLADVSSWQIETQDLDDLSVVRVREGDPATISFFAVPGLQLPGKVTRIKPLGKDDKSKVLYTVVIAPERWDDRLRWNMSAQVKIMPAK